MSIKDFFLKKTVKNTAIYAITDGIGKGISFLMLPIVSRYVVPSQLGIAANFDVLQQILVLLAGMAIVNGIYYFYYGKSREEVAKLVSSLLVMVGVTLLVISCVVLLFTVDVQKYLHIGIALQILAFGSSMALLINAMSFNLIRLEENAKQFSYLQIIQSLTHVIMVVIFVISLRMEALGKILSSALNVILFCFVHLYIMYKKRYLTRHIEWSAIKMFLKFGIPLLPHSMSFWIKSGMDKILLTSFCGLAANGIYSMAMSFGAVFSLFSTAFKNAYVPYLQKRLSMMTPENETAEKSRIVKLSYTIMLGFGVLYFIVVAFCWLVINFVLDEKYKPSFEYIPWIILSQTIYMMYSLVIEFPYTVKKTLWLGAFTFTGSLIQCAMTYSFLKIFGADGIKYSLVLGSLIIMLGVWWYSNKVYPMPWFSFFKNHKS